MVIIRYGEGDHFRAHPERYVPGEKSSYTSLLRAACLRRIKNFVSYLNARPLSRETRRASLARTPSETKEGTRGLISFLRYKFEGVSRNREGLDSRLAPPSNETDYN